MLGGRLFYPPGWADDGVGLELVVEPWLEGLWPLLRALQGAETTPPPAQDMPSTTHHQPSLLPAQSSPPPLEAESSLRYSPQLAGIVLDLPARLLDFLTVTWLDEDHLPAPASYQNGAKLPLADGAVQAATVVANRTLSHAGAVKTYKEITLSLGDDKKTPWLSYLPGDTIGVVCANPAAEVEEMARLLSLTDRLERTLAVSVLADTKKARAKVPEFVPRESRLRDLLSACLDLRAVVKKLLLRALVEHTTDPRERRRLEELSSKQVKLLTIDFLGVIPYK